MKRFASIIETVPQPCRIFGAAMRPFCLGHHLLLTRLGLPFADNPKADSTSKEFCQSVFLCAHSYEENLQGQLAGDWAAKFEKWETQIRKKNPSLTLARELFEKHLSEGYRIAPVWQHVSKSTVTMSAPWEQLLKCRLVAGGFSIADVMNGYLPERWYDYYTLLELKQAETSTEKDWKRIFYTLSDAMDDEAASQPPQTQEAAS